MRQMEIGLGMVGEHPNPVGEAVSDEDEEGGEEIEEGVFQLSFQLKSRRSRGGLSR